MTVHRHVNVHHKHISVASNFSKKLSKTRFEINKLKGTLMQIWQSPYTFHIITENVFRQNCVRNYFFHFKLHSKYLYFSSLILKCSCSTNFPVTTKNICAEGNPAHHFEKFSLIFYLSKFHRNMARRHG